MPAAIARGSLGGVVRSVTGAGLAGICVTAVGESAGTGAGAAAGPSTEPSGAVTAVSGAGGRYAIGGLLAGAYAVRYQACGHAARYASQWYGGAIVARAASRVLVSPVLISAERPAMLKPVTLRPATASGLVAASRAAAGATRANAARKPVISGVVTNAKGKRLSGICVEASFSERHGLTGIAGGSGTSTKNGAYSFDGLGRAHWTVEFQGGCGSKGNFAPQWWRFASKGNKAKPIKVTKGSHFTKIDAKLGPGAALSGVVKGVSSSGAGISGICVGVQGVGPMRDVFAEAKTGPGGKYRVTGLGTGRYEVDFEPGCGSKGDFLESDFPRDVAVADGKTTRGINGVLALAGKISGTVTSAAGQAPLSGICVDAEGTRGGISHFGESVTGAGGHYVIDGLAAGSYVVSFSAGCGSSGSFAPITYDNQVSQFAGTTVPVTAGQTAGGIDASMPRGGVVTGRVTDFAGHPLDGICADAEPVTDLAAPVSLVLAVLQADGFDGPSGGITRDGRYRISDLPPGSYRVAFAPGCGAKSSRAFAPQWYSPQGTGRPAALSVGPGPVSGVDVRLPLAGAISGVVTTPAGQPASGICALAVELSNQTSGFLELVLNESLPSPTNKHGAYRLGELAPGRYDVEFFSCGGAKDARSWYKQAGSQARAQAVTVRSGHVVAKVDQKMTVGTSISGTITKAGGGAPGARICLLVTDSLGNPVVFGTGNLAGDYTIGHLAPATYSVEFFPCSDGTGLAAVTRARVRLGAAPARVDVALPVAGVITGQVLTGGTPAPAAGVCVVATPVSGDGAIQVAFTGADGRYRLTALAAGRYRVTFSSACLLGPGGLIRKTLPAPVTVTSGETTSGGVTTLLADGGISGTVETGGKPVAGVCVLAFPKGSTRAAPAVAVTASSGSYRIGGLAPGSYVVEFTAGCGAAKFRTRWFDGASTKSAATPVAVTAAMITGGIDA